MKEYIEPEVEITEYLFGDIISSSRPIDHYGSETSNTSDPFEGGNGEVDIPDIIGGGDSSTTSGWDWGEDDP